MRGDVTEELAVIRGFAAAGTQDGVVDGFLWALSLVSGEDAGVLRARMTATNAGGSARVPPPPVTRPPVAVLPATVPAAAVPPDSIPPWVGLGMPRIERVRVAEGEVGSARAYTAGADGRPVPLESSYGELACDLLGDMAPPDSGPVVSSDATS